MSPKRLDRVAPPSVGSEWEVRFGTSEAAKGWDELCARAREKTRTAYELMRSNPRPPEVDSHHRLRGGLSTREMRGKQLEQWQVKVSGSGRIWYLPDDDAHTVWVVFASPGHPRQTE
jgi:mRNA-degrading endonuclease RelE of RelBE toxin-antitoxin system